MVGGKINGDVDGGGGDEACWAWMSSFVEMEMVEGLLIVLVWVGLGGWGGGGFSSTSSACVT
jgi:hypothetical protein